MLARLDPPQVVDRLVRELHHVEEIGPGDGLLVCGSACEIKDVVAALSLWAVEVTMPGELINKKTRYEFREFLVGWVLREIEGAFDSADIECRT